MKTRELFKETTKRECASFKVMRGGMHGFAGSGKSHTLALILHELPPSKRVSTAIAQVPVRTITQVRIDVDVEMFSRIYGTSYTNRLLKTAKDGIAISIPSGKVSKLKGKLRSAFTKPAEPVDQVEKELLVQFHQLDDSVESLEGHIICEMSDFGGQPQFLEILPRFLENMDFSIVVIDLSQNLDDHPYNYYYNKKGKSVGVGVKSPLTHTQVISLYLRMIASQLQGNWRVRFAFVGTHRDMEGMCMHKDASGKCVHERGECAESREEKNRRLREMVRAFDLEDNVIYKDRATPIFAVNALDPQQIDHETIKELRLKLLDVSMAREVSIPVSYYAVELTLKKKTQESGHIAFCESEILKEVAHYHFTKESLKVALRYLHDMKVIFYYEKDFPDKVIGEPQVVLNKHTEVVAYHIELTTNPSVQVSLDRKWMKFAQQGIISIKCLKKFPDHYVEGVFTPEDMMRLFEKLLIVSRVSEEEYLMPCVLQVDPQATLNPEPDTQSVPAMVLHFPGGPVRYGVFCGTICHVMTKGGWRLLRDADNDVPLHITRTSVHFLAPGCRGKVTINDPLDSFFVVTVHVPRNVPAYAETVSHLCRKVRDTLITAVSEVTKELHYSPDTPRVAFLCLTHQNSLHAAIAADVGDELLCCKQEGATGGLLTAGHRTWLRGIVMLHWLSCLYNIHVNSM